MRSCVCILVDGGRPRGFHGSYDPQELTGFYTDKKRKKVGFVIPEFSKDVIEGGKKDRPFFIVDAVTSLALPVGSNICEDEKLMLRLEAIFNKKVVKAISKRSLDTMELIITLFAGAGILYFALKLLSIFTHTVVTL